MEGRGLDQGQRRAALRRYAMGDDGLLAVEHRQVDELATDLAQRVDDGVRLAVQIHVGEGRAAELEQLDAQSIAIAMPVLVEQAELAHRRREPVRRAARKAGRVGDLRQRHRAARGREGFEDRNHLGQGLQRFVGAPVGWLHLGGFMSISAQSNKFANRCFI